MLLLSARLTSLSAQARARDEPVQLEKDLSDTRLGACSRERDLRPWTVIDAGVTQPSRQPHASEPASR